MEELKCIKEKCKFYFNSDNYMETCYLISKYMLLDKCFGLMEIPAKKEELICQIAKLVEELNELEGLENLIKNNQ